MSNTGSLHKGLLTSILFLGVALCLLVQTRPAAAQGDYRLGPGDEVTVFVLGVDEDPLSKQDIQIRPDGKISYPIAGEVVAAGKTPLELSQTIASALREMYKNPQVTITVRKFASNTYSVVGEVRTAGNFEWIPGINIKDALAHANGLTEVADFRNATLVRKDGTRLPIDLAAILGKGDSSKEVDIEQGDSLVIGLASVSVLGQVNKPASLNLRNAGTVSAAIACTEGLLPNADLDGAYIDRDGKKVPVNLRALIIKKDQTANLQLQPGDVLNIPISQMQVTVFGAVQKPGTYEMIPGEDDHLLNAISKAGGPSNDARMDNIRLVRDLGDGKKSEQSLDLSKSSAQANILLQRGDYIEISHKKEPMKLSDWASFSNTIYYLLRGL